MGIYKYPSIDNYWENNSLYKCIIPEIISKTYYYLLAFSLHFEEKENHNNENIDNKNSNSIVSWSEAKNWILN